MTLDDLVRMPPAELDRLYEGAGPGAMLSGSVRGKAIVWAGSPMAGTASTASRVVWQGKTFAPEGTSATNRFFGLPMIRGEVAEGPSWRDGGPSVIIDYSRTSWIYRNVRDEIREVEPGLYLGLMYRIDPPMFTRYFAFQADR
ncbi:MAG: hypothetical protein U0800_25065 [Isosphaeraceae bacterium]